MCGWGEKRGGSDERMRGGSEGEDWESTNQSLFRCVFWLQCRVRNASIAELPLRAGLIRFW